MAQNTSTSSSVSQVAKETLEDLDVNGCVQHSAIPITSLEHKPDSNSCNLSQVPQCSKNDKQTSHCCDSTTSIHSPQRIISVNETIESKFNCISKKDVAAVVCVKEIMDLSHKKTEDLSIVEEIDLSNVKEIVDLSNVKEIVDLSNVKEIVDLSNVEEIVNLSDVKEIADLSNVKEIADLSNVKEIVDLSNVKEIVDLSNFNEIVDLSNNSNVSSTSSTPKKSNDSETDEIISSSQVSQVCLRNQDVLPTSAHQELLQPEKQDLIKALQYIKHLEIKNSKLETEIMESLSKLNTQEISFKKAELQMRTEFLSNIEKLSKECNSLRKEKESIVIRYATSERDVIKEKKIQQELDKKMKDMSKEKENLLFKLKGLGSETSRLSSLYENKMVEVAKLQKNFDRLNEDFHSKEIRIKWLQNKLKTETNSHQETQVKLDSTVHRLNEMKEEAEQVRKDCQEMIKCYQEAEEIKSVKLDGQLKQKVCELEVQKQEKSDQEQIYQLLRQELEALKKKQRMTMEENNSLTFKIQGLEKDRLEYEQNLSKLKDNQNLLKQEVVDLNARLAEMETLRLQLEREKEKSAASLREVDRLRSTNAELQADMNACHIKEGELLKFTEGVTDTNVKLQSAHSLLEVKAQALEEELGDTRKLLEDIQQKHKKLVLELDNSRKQHEDEVQLLARKLAEKTKNVEKLNTKLDEAENENRVLKRRHIASIKELSRELYDCKRRLDGFESSNGIRTGSASLGSRSSSTASLDVMNSNENRFLSPPPAFYNGKKEASNTPPQGTPADIPEIDKEMLIERIIKLQKTLARRNDKIDFLEDHIVQLVKEMRKKNKCVDFKAV